MVARAGLGRCAGDGLFSRQRRTYRLSRAQGEALSRPWLGRIAHHVARLFGQSRATDGVGAVCRRPRRAGFPEIQRHNARPHHTLRRIHRQRRCGGVGDRLPGRRRGAGSPVHFPRRRCGAKLSHLPGTPPGARQIRRAGADRPGAEPAAGGPRRARWDRPGGPGPPASGGRQSAQGRPFRAGGGPQRPPRLRHGRGGHCTASRPRRMASPFPDKAS